MGAIGVLCNHAVGRGPAGNKEIKMSGDMRYNDAIERAIQYAREGQCSCHVNALVRVMDGVPRITAYLLSDWYVQESTVATVSPCGKVNEE